MFWMFLVGLVIGLVVGGYVIYLIMGFGLVKLMEDNNLTLFNGKIYPKKEMK